MSPVVAGNICEDLMETPMRGTSTQPSAKREAGNRRWRKKPVPRCVTLTTPAQGLVATSCAATTYNSGSAAKGPKDSALSLIASEIDERKESSPVELPAYFVPASKAA